MRILAQVSIKVNLVVVAVPNSLVSEFLPVTLSAKRGNWQRFMGRKANKAFLPVEERVFERDEHTCRYCGFQSEKYQVVVNADQDYSHNTLKNLVTACEFCAQCFFLDSVGLDGKSGGLIIQLPEISQTDLNHFCRALFCSMLRDTPYKGKLQAAYLSLQDRAKPVEDLFGPQAQNPVIFGQSIIDSGFNSAAQHPAILSELKLLPLRKYYKEQAEYWKGTVFANIPL